MSANAKLACDCIHESDEHDPISGACLWVNPTFGPCRCAGTPRAFYEAQRRVWKRQQEAVEALVLPVVHLNGTSLESLIEQRALAYSALTDAVKALAEMGPNGRDYYLKPGTMDKAEAQHRRRLDMLRSLLAEIEAECAGIYAQTN